jgi:putative oxygen-independent coproporphyrinogen III oxidase
MLLYIHVPFCRSRCRYCAFHSVALGKGVQAEHSAAVHSYCRTVLCEMQAWAAHWGKLEVESIFFGGGTPSLLPAQALGQLVEEAHRLFAVHPEAEISMEANPESLTSKEQACACRAAGINRLSLGVQSMDDAFLRILGRAHKAQDVVQAVSYARLAGISNINLDLMWALPQQSVAHWLHTLRQVLRLQPEHISAYALTLEEGTALAQEVGTGLFAQPDEAVQSAMFLEGAALLAEAGFTQYEISNFARAGFACRHNQGYWQGQDYLGLGPAATSTMAGRRWTNPSNQGAWEKAVQAHSLDAAPELLSPLNRVLEMIMLRLRTSRGLRLADYTALTGLDFMTSHAALVQALREHDLICLHEGCLCLTQQGMLLSNSIISSIFEITEQKLRAQGWEEAL